MPLLNDITPIDYYEMVDGIDTISSAVKLGPRKFRDAQNINSFPLGGFSWRQGYSALNSTAVSALPTTGLYMARFSSGTNTALMFCGTSFYSMSSLSGTWTDNTNGVTITSGKNNLWSFAMLNDIVIAANDTDTCLQITSGLVTTVLAGSPVFTSALFPIEFRGYMFYCNTVESATRQPDRLRFSDINAPNAFTMLSSNNFIDVGKKQGGDVRGAVNFDGRLYIFKRQGIYAIEFQPTRVNSAGTLFPFIEVANPIVEGVGTQSHRSICKFTTPITHRTPGQEIVFFVDQFGVPRLFDGKTTIQVGYSISKSRDTNILSLASMDKTRIGQYFAVNYPERSQIHCFMTKDGSQHDTDWILDYSTGFAWLRNAYNDDLNCGALFENTDGTFRLYFGDYAGKVYQYDTTQADSGVAISSYAIPGDAVNQTPILNSKWLINELRGSTGGSTQMVNIAYYVDGADTPSITDSVSLTNVQAQWDTMTWDQSQWAADGLVTKSKEINTDAKTLRVKFYNSTLNSTGTIEGYSLLAKALGWKES